MQSVHENGEFYGYSVTGTPADCVRLAACELLKDTPPDLLISGINPQLTRIFRITHLDNLFEFHENTEAAVSALRTS